LSDSAKKIQLFLYIDNVKVAQARHFVKRKTCVLSQNFTKKINHLPEKHKTQEFYKKMQHAAK